MSANGLASARKERTIEFRILGPLEVVEDGRTLSLGRGRERRLLGMLLLRANEVVSQDQLVDALWGESPPPTALTALHGSVSRLRGLLGAGRLQTTPPGYLLRLAPDELDLHRFERLVEEQRYEEALALWRGPALADLAFETFVQGEIARLEELRVAALEGRFERELADGRHAELVGELKAAVHAHPSRERLAAQLMVALYRCGRQAEALDAYRSVRTALVEELGLEPGEELRELQQRILAHDRRLDRVRPARRRATLPASTTSFVGRGRELGEVCALLERPELRLLTLIGAGGTGKTRLALEVAREMADEFRDGVRFVPLAAVADAALVAPEVAKALGLRQSQGQSIVDSVKAWVRGRELLLVLDNFEHVLEAAPFASELLAAAPGLKVLATSRRYLNLYGESEYAVPPLPVPGLQGLPDLEALGGNEAISLFVQRARAVKGDFALTAGNASPVADVCARLDGLPLAIELAAARVRAFAPAEILARLENRLELLTGGPRDVPARQRTLRDAILWSYELLPPGERRLFTRLAVFSGGWSPHTAVEVCGRDLKVDVRDALASLCAQNLIRREQAPHGRSRFTMLETIRELALEQLHASGEEAAIRGAHARAFLHAVEGEGPNLRGAARSEWLDRLANEHKNVRAALAWSVRDDGDIETGLRLAGAMFPFWMEHGSVSEAERFLSGLVSRSTEPSAGLGPALAATAFVAIIEGDLDQAEAACREGLHLLRTGEEWYRAVCLNVLGTLARYRGRLGEARVLYDEARAVATGCDLWWPASLAWSNLGVLADLEGRHQEAADAYERAVTIAREGGDSWIATMGVVNLARSARLAGAVDRAIELQAEALEIFARMDHSWGVAVCLEAFAHLAADLEQYGRAARLYGAEAAVRERAGLALWPTIQADHEAGVEIARAALGEAAWSQRLAEGREMTPQEGIAEALRVGALMAPVGNG